MRPVVKGNIDDLRVAAAQLKLSKLAIARRYGCRHQFVYAALSGARSCPEALRLLVEKMLTERRRDLRRILKANSGARRTS
jgi:cell division ATPase FtsA